MIGCCQGNDTFVAFQPMGISVSGETGNLLFSKDVYNLFFLKVCYASISEISTPQVMQSA